MIEHKMQAIQAKAVIKKAFDLGAKEAEAFLVMGLVLADSGQRPQAIAKMEEGLELNPGNKDLEKELMKIRKGK